VQVKNALHHQFIERVDPYVKPGDPTSGLVPRVHAGPPGSDGEGDSRVQAYNFRLCVTDRPENRRPWPQPERYDEKQYELLLRNFEAGDLRLPWSPVRMPNRKTDSNNNFAFSTDDIGMNYAYPDADYATRTRIWQGMNYAYPDAHAVRPVIRLQNRQPPRMRSLRRSRSPMKPASGAPKAYTHMTAEPIRPSSTSLNFSSSLRRGKMAEMDCRSP
jgi:hypothetical protein